MLAVSTFGAAWWYVTIYNAPAASAIVAPPAAKMSARPSEMPIAAAPEATPQELQSAEEKLQELGTGETTVESAEPSQPADAPPQEMGSLAEPTGGSAAGQIPEHFYAWFWGFAAVALVLLVIYYCRMDGEQLEILKELVVSVVPLGVLTVVVLAVILFGISTSTVSAAFGALGSVFLAVMA
jgi:TRAP-type mannitol/chloroaromatic compound transport system permease large subunit